MTEYAGIKFRSYKSKVYDSNEYYYKTFFPVYAGQLVVVSTKDGYSVGMVFQVGLSPENREKATRYLVQPIDDTVFLARLAADERTSELKAKMDRRVKELQENRIYEILAQDDPELAEMLIEYKEHQSNM